ncbi:hypothetical protein CWO91_08660 [Bradyrhizobium genosp. SA-3]|uniref:hypothetical protein n=1 Tax=Bradyrhizobium genosp. SA-3 TaxID=508868 RepID=UPI00102A6471|nr:hypothetical protein [Bradyrhizobium genosp. SA-3]RZN11343.1 hypothetical protein CWO91_08660 [Bradyrhizobium genosp. SA-3]
MCRSLATSQSRQQAGSHLAGDRGGIDRRQVTICDQVRRADAALDYTSERWRDELNELTLSGSVDDSEHPVSRAHDDEMSGCAELAREADIAHSSEPMRAL